MREEKLFSKEERESLDLEIEMIWANNLKTSGSIVIGEGSSRKRSSDEEMSSFFLF